MVCNDCVVKLALRLVRNHKLDWIDALTRAYKGIERFEERKQQEKPKILSGKGNPSDYSQSCSKSGGCNCADVGCGVRSYPCTPVGTGCSSGNTCSCGCPSPLPNSHYVSDDCNPTNNCSCKCQWMALLKVCICSASGSCSCSGACYYDCDEGYEWNGSECVESAPPPSDGVLVQIM